MVKTEFFATAEGGDKVARPYIDISFQRGFPRETGVNGCRVEDVIDVAIDRLEYYQEGDLACEENEQAIRCLREAQQYLRELVRRRQEQGVFQSIRRHRVVRSEDVLEDFSATGA